MHCVYALIWTHLKSYADDVDQCKDSNWGDERNYDSAESDSVINGLSQ